MAQPLPSANESYLWGCFAKKRDSHRDFRFFPLKIGFCPSGEEVIQRVHKTYLADPEFRTKWKGWTFGAFLTNYAFEITDEGAAILHRNDREALTK